MENISTKNINELAEIIANNLIENYGGNLVSKRGIRLKYELPYTKSTEIFYILISKHGFIEELTRNLRVPKKSDSLESNLIS